MEKTYGTTRILVVLPFTTSYVFIKYQMKGPDSFPDPDGLIYLWEPTRCAKLFSEENLKKLFEIVGKRITGLSGDEKEVSALLILFSLSFFHNCQLLMIFCHKTYDPGATADNGFR